ncbi:MAG: gamma carbonic anhydrase family protein [Pseudomonadota bacterium]
MRYALGDDQPIFHGTGQWIAPNATVIGKVEMSEASSVWFGAVVRGDTDRILIGARTNIQDASVLHTDAGIELQIEDDVTVGHQAMLHGCHIGKGSLIGIGSTILNHAVIGEQSLVGAHTLVTEGKTFPPGSLIVGSPAKVIRPLTEAEKSMLLASAAHYAANARRFASDLTALDER